MVRVLGRFGVDLRVCVTVCSLSRLMDDQVGELRTYGVDQGFGCATLPTESHCGRERVWAVWA